MTQQQPPQTPGNQVPDHRLAEITEQNRQLLAQVQKLQTFINQSVKPQQQPEEDHGFKPEVQASLKKFFEAQIKPIHEFYQNNIGMLHDQLDEAKFQQNYSTPQYEKYMPKVEQIRKEYQAQNKWISREEALRYVFFEETGKKPVEAPAPAKKAPIFSPYFGAHIDPDTGLPVQPPEVKQEAPAQTQTAPQQQVPQQVPQGMPWPPQHTQQQVPHQMQPQPQMQTQMPPWQGNIPALPTQGVNQQVPVASAAAQRGEISLESSDADLQAFEEKFGDIPF